MEKNLFPNKACLLAMAPAGLCISALGAPVVHKDIYAPGTVILEDFSGVSDPSTSRVVTTFNSITGGAATYDYAASAGSEGYINYSTLAKSFDPALYKSLRLRMAINRDSASSTSIDVFPTPVPGAGSVNKSVTTGTDLKETSFDLSTKSPNGIGVRIDPFNYTNDGTADQCQIDYIMADLGPTIGFEFNHDADLNQASLTNITSDSVTNGALSGTSSTGDPQISFTGAGKPTIDAGIYKFVEIRMKGDPGDRIDLFWNTAAKGGTGSAVVVESTASSDGAYHTYLVDFSSEPAWTGNLTTLRLDPTTTLGSTFEVDYVRFMKIRGPEVLFADDFDVAKGTSVTNPAGRATGTLASTVKYAWSDTAAADVAVDGTLNWDSNGDKTALNEQPAANGTQSLRFGTAANSGHFNWYPYVSGKIWEVEYDILTGNSHSLSLGLSDTTANGAYSSFDSASYDFGFGNFGGNCRYDTDNNAGAAATEVLGIFPTRSSVYNVRIRFNEPLGKATMYVNGAQVAETSALDFENNARYITFGEPTNFAGHIDNLKVSIALPEPFAVTSPPELIANGNQFQISPGAASGPTPNQYNIAMTFGDFSAYWGSSAVVTGWTPFYLDPDGLTGNIGLPGVNDTGALNGTYYLDTVVDLGNDWFILNSSNNYLNGLKREDILNGVTIKAGATYQLKIDVSQNSGTDQSLATFTAALTKGAGSTNTATAVTGSLLSLAANTLPTAQGTLQTATISGADLLAAQTGGPVNLILQHLNTDAVAGYPGSPNPLDITQVSQVRIASVSLTPVAVANDLNKDGVFDAEDVALSNLYLAGNGGQSADVRQAALVAQGMTAAQALAYLNLTAFDTDGNGTFNAADVTLLQSLLPSDTPDQTVIIDSAQLTGGDFVLQISDLTIGREYRLMRSTDLINFNVQVDSVTAASASATLTDPDPPAGRAFYRVAN